MVVSKVKSIILFASLNMTIWIEKLGRSGMSVWCFQAQVRTPFKTREINRCLCNPTESPPKICHGSFIFYSSSLDPTLDSQGGVTRTL